MTASQFRRIQRTLDMTQAQLARAIGKSLRAVHGYANGALIPRDVQIVISMMLENNRRRPRAQPLRTSR